MIRRLQPQLAQIPGISLYMQPIQDLTIDDRVSRTQYQYSVNALEPDEVSKWTKLLVAKLQTLPELRDVASDQQESGLQTAITIDRDTASRLGITAEAIDNALYDAFGQRQISTMFTQRNQYHVILEALPQLLTNPNALTDIYLTSATGGSIPLSTFTQTALTLGPLLITH